MIAYFVGVITGLFHVILHRLGINREIPAVLFVDEAFYKSRHYLEMVMQLKKNGIFEDVIPCKMLFNVNSVESTDAAEDMIVREFDNLFAKLPYNIEQFDKIYSLFDNWEGYQNIYFIKKGIKFIWFETYKNHVLLTANRGISSKLFCDLMDKYKALSPLAPNAKACIFDSSDKIKIFLVENGIEFEIWDFDLTFKSINRDDLEKLFISFDLKNNFPLEVLKDKKEKTLLIKNSYGALNINIPNDIKNSLGFAQYQSAEIFSVMDKISLDFYAPASKTIYYKHHIHDWLDQIETERLYGPGSVSILNAPFQIIDKYFACHDIKFDYLIGTASTSLLTISQCDKTKTCLLGMDFAKTWYFYISLYVSILFAKECGFKIIFCDNAFVSQLNLLAKEIGFTADIIGEFRNNVASSLTIYNAYTTEFELEYIDRSSAVIALNVNFSKKFFLLPENLFVPIKINKQMISEISCDILYYDEILWIFSKVVKIRSKARSFKFERILRNLGMRISAEKIPAPLAVKMYRTKQMLYEHEINLGHLNNRIQLLCKSLDDRTNAEIVLKTTTDIHIYFDALLLLKYKYLIVMSIRDTPGDYIDNELMRQIHDFGFTRFSKELWRMYIGVSLKNYIVFNKGGDKREEPVNYQLKSNPLELSCVSEAWKKRNFASININGIEYAVNIRGLNIVVYDIDHNELIDSVGFDWHYINRRFVRK